MTSLKKNKVLLGLSGGVDSTTAALLLQEKGLEVTGLYFDVKEGQGANQLSTDCLQKSDTPSKFESLSDLQENMSPGFKAAKGCANQLGIELIYKNVSCEFNQTVISNFCSEYGAGKTPNPCIICNPLIKFKTLVETADSIGAHYIATGHYAGTYYDEEEDLWFIKRAKSVAKDQSYMLYRLGQEVISRLLLPLDMAENKEAVRSLAKKNGLSNAQAKDSQEICFIDDDMDYKEFLHHTGIKSSEGDFVDSEGNIVGRHKGILNYTIGQRKGLGITFGKPVFVTRIDAANNRVYLGDNEELFSREVVSDNNIFMGTNLTNDHAYLAEKDRLAASFGIIGLNDDEITAKIRYAAKPADASIRLLDDGKILTVFKEPQRAVTPGQSIVLYKNDIVIGGGFIE